MATVMTERSPCDFGNSPTVPRESSVNALKSLLSLPTANVKSTPKPKDVPAAQPTTPQEPEVSKKKSRVLSPPNVSPDSKLVPKSTKKSKKKTEAPTTPSYFAGSAFQNSPDPISIPIPSFDDETPETVDQESVGKAASSPAPETKTILLRRLLRVEK
jgi:hypothetical protein